MTFDFDAALAEILAETPATIATPATNEQNQQVNVATLLRHACDIEGQEGQCRNFVASVSQDKALNNNVCRNVATVASPPNSTNSTNSTGQVIPWPGRGYPPEAIQQGVADAFEDWEAMNDPHDWRAWT